VHRTPPPTLRLGLLVSLFLAPALLCLCPARADEATPALKKFQKPVDDAIDKALTYLAKQQDRDGSFPTPMGRNTGITALSVMAFLAKGHVPGRAPYGETINRGIDSILDSQHFNGMLVGSSRVHGPMYCHTIATLLLSEVSGMVDPERQRRIDEALGKALRVILSAQQSPKSQSLHAGGWRYQIASPDSDISCSGWALMSLRSARNSGAAVPTEAIEAAVRFVLNCRSSEGGFAYQPGGPPGLARTGTGLLCLELCGHHRDRVTLAAGDWILHHLPNGQYDDFFYYGMYYASQGMFQLGDEHWERFGEHMYRLLLRLQRDDGSWPESGGNERQAGPCYSTAMAVLAMSVAHRQLPIYQR